jgi:hypothetical protein
MRRNEDDPDNPSPRGILSMFVKILMPTLNLPKLISILQLAHFNIHSSLQPALIRGSPDLSRHIIDHSCLLFKVKYFSN